jgi:hypothetical protein
MVRYPSVALYVKLYLKNIEAQNGIVVWSAVLGEPALRRLPQAALFGSAHRLNRRSMSATAPRFYLNKYYGAFAILLSLRDQIDLPEARMVVGVQDAPTLPLQM